MNSEQAIRELKLMIDDQASAGEQYQPTVFWSGACQRILDELEKYGFESFRCAPTPKSFFVPTYGSPGNSIPSDWIESTLADAVEQFGESSKPVLTLKQMLSGESWANADFRCYLSGNDPETSPHLEKVSESKTGNPEERFEFEGRFFSRSLLNYLNGLVFLKQNVDTSSIRSVLEVGGGFGTLGEILHADRADYSYVDVDIPPTAAVSAYYLSNLPGNCVHSYSETRESNEISVPVAGEQIVLCPWQLERMKGKIDLFVNFISFQEMEPEVVANYLSEAKRLGTEFILLRNLREGKAPLSKDPVHGVKSPITSEDYIGFLPEFELVARSVFPFGYRTVDGFHSELLLFRR